MNEAFAGAPGLVDFRKQLDLYLDQLARLHPGAQLVLLAPMGVEQGGQVPDVVGRNRDIAAYARTIGEVGKMRRALFVDLFALIPHNLAKSQPLTVNGLHPDAAGNRQLAVVIARALLSEAAVAKLDSARVRAVAQAVARKNYYVAEVARPKNADLYYGVRKRADENAAEIPRYHRMIAATEAAVNELATSSAKKFADFPRPWLEPLAPIKGYDDGKSTGVIKPPAEAQAEFQVADGYSVNLFASEAEFPELKTPVQIAFDACGRLWVVTMPSFPHTVPGLPPSDKIVVLEDTDHDGKADQCTTFAEGFDALDGVAFTEQGVIVSEQPKLWLMNDTNGDGRADTKTELLRGIDVTDLHHGGMIATDPVGDWPPSGSFDIITAPDGADLAPTTVVEGFPLLGRLNQESGDVTKAEAQGAAVRIATGLAGFTTPLSTMALSSPYFMDTTASGVTLTYLVRATKLQATGSGSFWNLNQGTFITVP